MSARGKRRVLLIAIVFLVAINNGTKIGRTQVQPAIDLNGKWKLDSAPNDTVVIDHLLPSGRVVARFSPPAPCHNTYRNNLFDTKLKVTPVSGSAGTITLDDGAFEACTGDKKLIDACPARVTAVWTTRFRNAMVSADGRTITGERFHEYVLFEGCKGDPTQDGWSTFTLTRCDKLEPCKALVKVIGTINKVIPPGDSPTVAEWNQKVNQYKPELAANLDDLREHLCGNSEAQSKVDEWKAGIEPLGRQASLSSQALLAERMKMAEIDLALKVLATTTCSVSGPVPPPASGVCQGVPAKQPGDNQEIDKIINEIKKRMDEAIKKAEQYERDRGGASATAGQYADYYRTEAAKYRKLIGYWNNVRAATCVPREVIDLLRAVAGGRTDMCTRLCQKTADWIGKMYPGSQGEYQKAVFFVVCSANCPE